MEEINIKEIFKGIWKRKLIIIIFTIIFLSLGILFSSKTDNGTIILGTSNKVTKYATAIFTVTQTEEYKIEEKTVNSYFNILKTKTRMNDIITKLDLDITVNEFKESFEMTRQNYTDIIEINIINEKLKDDAIDILNEFLIILDTEIKRVYPVNEIYIIEKPYLQEAEEPKVEITNGTVKEQTNTKEIIIITLAGVIFGFVTVVGLEVLDTSIKNEEQLFTNFKVDNLAVLKGKNKNYVDELRKVKLSIKDKETVMITGLTSKKRNEILEGLKELYVKYGKKVSYIDIIEEKIEVYESKDSEFVKTDNIGDLEVLLEKEEIIKVFENMKKQNDIVLINANDINVSINSLAMCKFVDSIICIVEERKTKLLKFEKMLKKLNRFEANFIGTILIKK